MGKLYDNNKIIGYYHGSYVTVNYSDTKEIAKYDRGLITVNGHYVATCDENGYIYSEQNRAVALARCKDGCVHDLNRSGYNVIAYYDGDMYGAAAAVATLILNLGVKSNVSTSDNSSVQTNSSSPSPESSSSLSGGDSASSSDGGCIAGAVKSIFVLVLKLLTFSLTPVIGAAVCMVLNAGFVLPFIPHLIIALCLFDARRKGLISESRGYVAAILQNLHWIMLFLGFIPFFEVLLSPIMKNNYIVLIIMYCMPFLSFLIVWTGVRKHKKAIKKQKKLLKKQEKERKKQEKLQAKNNNT